MDPKFNNNSSDSNQYDEEEIHTATEDSMRELTEEELLFLSECDRNGFFAS